MVTKKESLEQRDEKFRYWLQQNNSPSQSMGIGIHNDQYYFGTTVRIEGKATDIIITSKKEKFIGSEIKTIFGLNYRFSLFSDCIDYTWSNESIDRWLYDEGLEEEEFTLKKCYDNKNFMSIFK